MIDKGKENWKAQYGTQVCGNLRMFFNRKTPTGELLKFYPDSVKSTGEYKKIDKYMGIIEGKATCPTT